jgi:hypothetical protein
VSAARPGRRPPGWPRRRSWLSLSLWGALVGCGAGVPHGAETRPVQNIDPQRHANLAAAQDLSARAFDRLVAAQQANEWDLGGHAAAAERLLAQANSEMKAAAIEANRRTE